MKGDPIVEEVRRIKEQIAAQYGNDVRKLGEALKRQQAEGGRNVVSFAKRPPVRQPE